MPPLVIVSVAGVAATPSVVVRAPPGALRRELIDRVVTPVRLPPSLRFQAALLAVDRSVPS